MIAEPRLEDRKERPYAAVRTQVPIPFGGLLPGLWGEAAGFLEKRGLSPSGPPFIRYLTTDMTTKLNIEVGYPLDAPARGEGRVTTGLLPAGRYVVVLYTGPYDQLVEVTAGLLEWAKKKGIDWRTQKGKKVERWAGRLEWYLTDPAAEPDPWKWQTELAFLTAQSP
jgi:effector-binding domain-containing protein